MKRSKEKQEKESYEVTRSIAVYDNITERLVVEFNIDHIPFAELKSYFMPPKKDPLMYDCYEIKIENIEFFVNRIDVNFDFEAFSYFVECYQK